jgi:hypothetical protein
MKYMKERFNYRGLVAYRRTIEMNIGNREYEVVD